MLPRPTSLPGHSLPLFDLVAFTCCSPEEGFRLTRTLSWIISLLRAYVFGYLSSTGPRILTTLFLMLRKGQSKTDTIANVG